MRCAGSAIVFFSALVVLLVACGDDVEAEDDNAHLPAEDCAPLYEPTFAEIQTRTFIPTCSPEGGSCHATEGAASGLILDDDQAYDRLLGVDRPRALVVPGSAEDSVLAHRVSRTEDMGFVMPLGMPMDDPEICTIVTWIREGAQP